LSNTGLEELNLGCNQLGIGVLKIATAIESISMIKILNLCNNEIPAEVATELASAIASNFFIEELRLGGNRLMTSGIVTIARSLSMVSSLKVLDFSETDITEEAADTIALVIISNPGLEKLYLGGNQLGAGITKIAAASKNTSTFETFGIEGQSFDLSDSDLDLSDYVLDLSSDSDIS